MQLQAFHEALASGAVGHLVKEWEPWWYTAGAREKRLTRSGGKTVRGGLTNEHMTELHMHNCGSWRYNLLGLRMYCIYFTSTRYKQLHGMALRRDSADISS
jgi:hypothetical protein